MARSFRPETEQLSLLRMFCLHILVLPAHGRDHRLGPAASHILVDVLEGLLWFLIFLNFDDFLWRLTLFLFNHLVLKKALNKMLDLNLLLLTSNRHW